MHGHVLDADTHLHNADALLETAKCFHKAFRCLYMRIKIHFSLKLCDSQIPCDTKHAILPVSLLHFPLPHGSAEESSRDAQGETSFHLR